MRGWMVVLLLGLVLLPSIGGADEREWRFGLGGGGMVLNARAGGSDATGVGFGARGRLGHDFTNAFGLAVVAEYAHASDLRFNSASLENQSGTLFADVSLFCVGVELRWTAGLGLTRAFERTSPYLAVRAGAAIDLLSSQQLFTANNLLLLDAKDNLRPTIFAAAALGLEHRFGDHFFLAAELAGSWGSADRSVGVVAEAAWAWY